MSNNNLHLYEEIMLLALKDEEGTIPFGTMYNFALSGAFVAELLLENRIEIDDSKKKKVEVVNDKKMYDPLLDECLNKIDEAKKERRLQTWVSEFASLKGLKHRTAKQLCQRGILKTDEKDVLLIFKKKIYPEINPEPEKRLKSRLENALFSDTMDLDPRTVVIIALASKTGLLEHNFDKKELKKRKDRIEKITQGNLAGTATDEAIRAMQAAVIAATTAASTAAVVASS